MKHTLLRLALMLSVLVPFDLICSQVDSIYLNCRNSSRHDTDFIKCLDLKSFDLANVNPELGLKIGSLTLRLAMQSKWQRGMALAYNEMGVNYYHLGYLDSAIYCYSRALKLFAVSGNLKAQSSVMTNISMVFKSKGNYHKSLEYLNRAYSIQEKLRLYLPMGITLENIGTVYLELKNMDKARKYYADAKSIYVKLGDSQNIARNLLNMGIIYDKFGLYDSALSNFNEALRINTLQMNLNSIQMTYSNLGNVYSHKKAYDKAIEQFNQAIRLSKEMNSDYSLATDYGNLGEVYLDYYKSLKRPEDLDLAIAYLKKGYYLCQSIGFTPPQIEFGEKLLVALEYHGGNYELAYDIFKHTEHLQDSIFSKDNLLKIQKLEIENEMVKKEHELKLSLLENKMAISENKKVKQQQTILILALIILVLVLFLLYVIYTDRNRLFKLRMNEISQIQSHEVRTPVVKILSLVSELQDFHTEDEEHGKLLKMLKVTANDLDQIIHDIVNKARRK